MSTKEQHKPSGIKIGRDESTACIITTVQYERQTKFQKHFRSKDKDKKSQYVEQTGNKTEANAVLCISTSAEQIYYT